MRTGRIEGAMTAEPHSQGPGLGGPRRGYSWAPFEPGHERSLVHGTRSPRTVGPLAERIEREARADPSWPDYLTSPEYGPAVAAWARSEAIVELLWRYLADQDVEHWLTEQAREESEETRTPRRTRRISTARRVTNALASLQRWETTAANHRSRLGLDPLSRARLGKDVAAARVDIARVMSGLDPAPPGLEWLVPGAGVDGGAAGDAAGRSGLPAGGDRGSGRDAPGVSGGS
jgi:hypothetical protein